ncbi:MAG: hypothetical protein JNG84_13330 [Archangium sp.]|nr:hypothetical protein [Archangium sp.]
MRVLVVVVGLLVAGCQCRGSDVGPAKPGELAASVTRLNFRSTYVGQTRRASVDVSNVGGVLVAVDVSVDGPFSIDPAAFELGRSETRAVQVTFAPTAPGPASATVKVGPLEVEVSGEGLEVPACVASDVCHGSLLDREAQQCVESVHPDDTACATACVTGACVSGVCRGVAVDCSDADACTVDTCSEALGCTRSAVVCPTPASPCEVARCETASGCGAEQAPDGTPCGPDTCASEIDVCILGRCLKRARPVTDRCTDGGVDGGADAGLDGGRLDAGVIDAGSIDGGLDAGRPDAGYVGGACVADADCIARMGPGAVCKQHPSNDPAGTYPGGFCTRLCSASQPCPPESVCSIDDGGQRLSLFSVFGENDSYCAPACDPLGPDVCRPEYTCLYPFDGMLAPFCWWDFSDPDPGELRFALGQHAARVGTACTSDSDCASLDGGLPPLEPCITELPSGTSGENFVGGYCTGDATLDYTSAFCQPDSWALFVVGSGYQCFAKCDRPQAGRGSGAARRTCRMGYVCTEYIRLADGGFDDGYCDPGCVSNSECDLGSDGGRLTCNVASGYCQTECTTSADCPRFTGSNTFAPCTGGKCQY